MIKLPDYHKSLDVLHYGCEEPRAYFIPYQDDETAALARSESRYFHSLCGEWDFRYYADCTALEENFDTEKIVERFVRADASRTTEGSGLGLNIAESLVELQGGSMRLTVDGDLFKVTLMFPQV